MENPFVSCPFNPQHRMLKLRLQYHIVKCQKNYVSSGMKPCPYNATHIVPKEQYRDHIQTCPDSVLIEGHKYDDIHVVHGKLNEGAFHFDLIQDEKWDSPDTDVASDSQSQTSESKDSIDYSQYYDLLNEYDEDEEPLQRYIYEEKKSERFSTDSAEKSSTSTEGSNMTCKEHPDQDNLARKSASSENLFPQFGAGRGRILSRMALLNN